MSKLDYNGKTHLWEGSIETNEEFFHVHMTDETFRTHFHAYLESLDIPTQSYLEMMAHVDKVGQQQYEALQQFTAELDRWRECKDKSVRIYALTARKP